MCEEAHTVESMTLALKNLGFADSVVRYVVRRWPDRVARQLDYLPALSAADKTPPRFRARIEGDLPAPKGLKAVHARREVRSAAELFDALPEIEQLQRMEATRPSLPAFFQDTASATGKYAKIMRAEAVLQYEKELKANAEN